MATESHGVHRERCRVLIQTRAGFIRSINTGETGWGIDSFTVYSVISNRVAMRNFNLYNRFLPGR